MSFFGVFAAAGAARGDRPLRTRSPGFYRLACASALTLALGACGGDGEVGRPSAPPVTTPDAAEPAITASTLDSFGGGTPVSFSGGTADTTWTLSGAGTLTVERGAATEYVPPAEVASDASVTVTAITGSARTSKAITLHAPQLRPVSSAIRWYVGDGAITLTTSPRFTDAVPAWSVDGGGSLSAATGRQVVYTPPAVSAAAEAVVSVRAGGVTEALKISLAPASAKTLLASAASVRAGSGNTVTLTVPGGFSHGALTWNATMGGVVANGGGTAIFTPPPTLGSAAVATVTATDGVSAPFSAVITVTASPTLSISPSVNSVTAGSLPVSLTATVDGVPVVADWTLASGTGSLGASTGSTVSYIPDPANTAPNGTAVVSVSYQSYVSTVTVHLNFQSSSTFVGPKSIGIDASGNLVVADSDLFRRITPAGAVSNVPFSLPFPISSATAVAFDSAGNLYTGHTHTTPSIVRLSPSGAETIFTAGTCPTFGNITGFAFDSLGNFYVSDWSSSTICRFAAGSLTGEPLATVVGIWSIAVDSADNLYATNSYNHELLKIAADGGISVVASGLPYPTGLALDAAGNAYVGDRTDYRIRKVSPAGVVTPLAGSTFGLVDGTGSAAAFGDPTGMTIDAMGNLYVADTGRAIRMVTPAGVVTTIAGNGVSGGANGTALPRPWPTLP